jgi:hypothetical protein
MDFPVRVKLAVYETIASTARAPTAQDIAHKLGASVAEVESAFVALHTMRLLVPEPVDPSRIRMAPPFSGVPTMFRAIVNGKVYDANCSWDAFGISAALHADATIEALDGHTGEPISLCVRNGRPEPVPCVAHFAVPAAHWWVDIVYT